MKSIDRNSDAVKWYKQAAQQIKASNPKPEAIVVISAHWETSRKLQVTSNPSPDLLFDYYGFPDETYHLTYPCPGSSHLANKICGMLTQSGIECELNGNRGLDHGVFIPLKLIYPQADIPIVQLSINSNLDPAYHIALGRALRPLRNENILLFGSGEATHDLAGKLPQGKQGEKLAHSFIEALSTVLTDKATTMQAKQQAITKWHTLPAARQCHPREEHLVPLFVIIGAAHDDETCTQLNDHWAGWMSLACFAFS